MPKSLAGCCPIRSARSCEIVNTVEVIEFCKVGSRNEVLLTEYAWGAEENDAETQQRIEVTDVWHAQMIELING